MQHLNIPLSRNTKTSRRIRWDVWIWIGTACFSFLFAYWVGILWFVNDAIYDAAPEHTVLSIRFILSEKNAETIQSLLENTSLVSHRSVLFSDLAGYTSREMVLFVDVDGSKSVAIRENGKKIPVRFFESQNIVQETVSKHILLLSEKPIKRSDTKIKPRYFPGISFPNRKWVGEFIDHKNLFRSDIYAKASSIEVVLNKDKPKFKKIRSVPSGTIAYLSTPVLSENNNSYTTPTLPLLDEFTKNEYYFLKNINITQNQLYISKTDTGLGYFLNIQDKNKLYRDHLEQIVRSIHTLNHPQTKNTLLPDGTTMKELVQTDEPIAIKQEELFGQKTTKTQINGVDLLSGTLHDENYFLTNSEFLLRSVVENNNNDKQICDGNMLGMKLGEFRELFLNNATSPNTNTFFELFHRFDSLGLENSGFRNVLHLCK